MPGGDELTDLFMSLEILRIQFRTRLQPFFLHGEGHFNPNCWYVFSFIGTSAFGWFGGKCFD